ncbi:MAG: hypothetical protein J2P13_01770 [Acidobacteria bacterium]|nr:hypothetical protein [Acidobacteriota bacterium]
MPFFRSFFRHFLAYFLTNPLSLNRVRSSRSVFSQVPDMKNVYEVLRQKELELARLEKEVEALRVAAPLLSDDKENAPEPVAPKPAHSTPVATPQQPIRIPQPAVSTSQPAARAAGWEESAKRWP